VNLRPGISGLCAMRQQLVESTLCTLRSNRFVRPLSLLLLMLPGLVGISQSGGAEVPPDKSDIDAYVRDIAKAQAALDARRVAEARKLLDATDKTFRRFEFAYLQARLQAGQDEGKPAPELIRKGPKPDVENRYGVLDELRRQVVYICRDGSLRMYDLKSLEADPRQVKHPLGAAVWSGSFSRDGKTFLSGHQNGDVLVWDAVQWKIRHTIALGNDWPVRELASAPDGSACVVESQSALELWSLADEKPQRIAAVGERYNFGAAVQRRPIRQLHCRNGLLARWNADRGLRLRKRFQNLRRGHRQNRPIHRPQRMRGQTRILS